MHSELHACRAHAGSRGPVRNLNARGAEQADARPCLAVPKGSGGFWKWVNRTRVTVWFLGGIKLLSKSPLVVVEMAVKELVEVK